MLEPLQYGLGAGSGALVGFVLALVGGGGSILAVPLMIYLVGVANPHVALGTSAFAVAVNAATGIVGHARAGTVRWRCALIFAGAGVVGAFGGSTAGKAFDGQRLLSLFAIVMILVGALMLRGRTSGDGRRADCGRRDAPKVGSFGLAAGVFSGFFGIGGGFLIVPGLMASTNMPVINAIGSSLVVVAAFGFTTAFSYTLSGLVDWPLAAVFISGGILGGVGGTRLAAQLSNTKDQLTRLFAGLIFAVALYMLWCSAPALV